MTARPAKLPADDLAEVLAMHERAMQRSAFLHCASDGADLRDSDYRSLCERIGRFGGLFAEWGLRPGSHLLIASADDLAVATTVLACLHHGVVAMVVDPQAKPDEVAALLAIQAPEAMVVDRALLATWPVAQFRHRLPVGGARRRTLVGKLLRRHEGAPEEAGWPEAVDARPPVAAPERIPAPADAYILFTSGSTGRPKGVRIGRAALARHLRTLVERWGYDARSRILDILPLHHADGLVQGVLCAWASGGCCVRTGTFTVPAAIALLLDPIYRERITHLVTVPAMMAILLRYAEAETEAFRGDDFRFVISSAGYLDEQLWRAFEERFRVRVCNIYGLTETVTGGCFAGPDDASHVIGTVGLAVDGAVRVVDEAGVDAGLDVPGELQMRGPHLMSGYLNDDAASAEAMTADGWLRTGDLATIDAAGLVRIVGRRKNLVITGGLNIHPEEVAEALRAQPGVADAVAFGLPDPDFGEVLVACVSARDEVPLDLAALRLGCQARLSDFKLPRTIVQLPALPYGPSGKVVLARVRELFQQSARPRPTPGGDLRGRLYAVAAEAFRLPADRLGPHDAPGRTAGWDSFAHLAFVTGLEAEFRLRLRSTDILAIRTLGDAERIIARCVHG